MAIPRKSLVVAVALMLAGCAQTSGGTAPGGKGAGGTAVGANATPTDGPVSVTVGTLPGGRQYLTDNAGRAIYLFGNDTATASACTGVCATNWPPLPGRATAGTGLLGPLVSITRSDGSPQAAYRGHPLYYFIADKNPGDIKGHGLSTDGGHWYLLDPAGNAVTTLVPPTQSGPGGY